MAATWPASLQQLLSQANFGEEPGDNTIRSEMDYGPSKVRRRSTGEFDKLSGSIYLTVAQYSTFKNFYETTLAGGTLTFDFNHPITGTSHEYRFMGTPKYSTNGGTSFMVSFQWERVS